MRSRYLSVSISLVLVALVLGGGWAVSRGAQHRSSVAAALDALPASAATVDFTDWSQIDDSLDAAGLKGLTTRSVLAALDTEIRDQLGWSATEVDWEAYGRTDGGDVTAIGLGDVSVQRAERSFAATGSAVDGDPGVYRLDEDTTASADFVSTFAWVRIVPGRDLVLGAPDRASLDAASDAVSGRSRSLLNVRAVADLAGRLRGATSLLLQDRQFLCLASRIGPGDAAAGRQLSAALGPSDRLTDPVWGGRALFGSDPQRLVFATVFGSDAVARDQIRVRESLTEGRFIGRTGRVDDSLRDLRSAVSGDVVSLDFQLTPEGEQFMTDTGPVVFAGCAP